MRTRRVLVTSALAAVFAAASLGPATAESFPDIIPIPTGSLPEGIATGTGTSIYAGSRADGSVWLGDLRTGEGDILVEGTAGRMAVGIKVENGLLFVSGGTFGDAYVYDALRACGGLEERALLQASALRAFEVARKQVEDRPLPAPVRREALATPRVTGK